MLIQLLLSLVGLVFAYRISHLLQRIELLNYKNSMIMFVFFQVLLLLSCYFKELSDLNTLLIGISAIILILSSQINCFFRRKTFEKLHLSLIQQILIHISCGHSPKSSVQMTFGSFSKFEKYTFGTILSDREQKNIRSHELSVVEANYYEELLSILNSSSHVKAQLMRFRGLLNIKKSLRHRSGQVLIQIRAQAVICFLLYVVVSVASHQFLQLQYTSTTYFISIGLLLVGLYLILSKGQSLKWKT